MKTCALLHEVVAVEVEVDDVDVDPYGSFARTNQERSFFSACAKEGLSLDCQLEYVTLPVASGEDELGNPIVSLQPWPFILPHIFVLQLELKMFF